MIFVPCPNPDCSAETGITPHVDTPAEAYCSMLCWRKHHAEVAAVREEQRHEARDALDRQLRRLAREREGRTS